MENISIEQYAGGTLFPALNTCLEGHDHGRSLLELRWHYSEPTTVFAYAGLNPLTGDFEQTFVVSRDLLLQALRSGASAGYPVVGVGNVTCKVMRNAKTMLSIRFNEGYTILVDRDSLTAWITGTFVHVPANREEQVLDMDFQIQQLLNQN